MGVVPVMPVHERPVGESVEWYTPPTLFESLGVTFDLDPASPGADVVPWVPAVNHLTKHDDGTLVPWFGLVWLNPPYGRDAGRFIWKMTEHGHGMMLLPARTETENFQYAARNADAICFLKDRLHFIRPDGYQARASFGSVLFAYGAACKKALAGAGLGFTV